MDKLLNQIKKENPSAEIFKVHSLDGRKIVTSTFDGREHSCESCFKKEGFLVLFTNY